MEDKANGYHIFLTFCVACRQPAADP